MSSSLETLDWFIPFNFEALNKADGDLGSSGVLLIPNTNLLTSGGKGGGQLYMLDRDDLGHLDPDGDRQIIQSVTIGGGGLYGTATYWNGPNGPNIYVWPSGDVGKMYKLQGQRLSPVPASKTKDYVEMPGASLPFRPTER